MHASFVVSATTPDQYPPSDRPEVAFAGKSNVGKSSLLNRLVNRRNLAITSSRPGRTRSINFFAVGSDLYFVDLPGYGYARVPVKMKKSWQAMVERYLRDRSTLKGVIVILDIRRGADSQDLALFNWLNHHKIPALPVLTKADKLSKQKAFTTASTIEKQLWPLVARTPIVFSARSGMGTEQLWEAIRDLVKA